MLIYFNSYPILLNRDIANVTFYKNPLQTVLLGMQIICHKSNT